MTRLGLRPSSPTSSNELLDFSLFFLLLFFFDGLGYALIIPPFILLMKISLLFSMLSYLFCYTLFYALIVM